MEEAPLASGWKEHETAQGVKFYFNERLGKVRWTRPVEEEAVAEQQQQQHLEREGHRELKADSSSSPSVLGKRQADDGVEDAVEEMSERRRELQSKLSSKDAILDPRVVGWMREWLLREGEDEKKRQKRSKRDVDLLIEMLASGYEGFGEYVGLLMRWLTVLNNASVSPKIQKGSSVRDLLVKTNSRRIPPEMELVVDHVAALASSKFDEETFAKILEGSPEEPPKWLIDLICSDIWRKVLIKLANQHQNVPLLKFAIKAMCKEGHHDQVAEIMSTASYFAVFSRIFTDTLRAILEYDHAVHRDPSGLARLEERFHEICMHSQYTYMFAMEALEVLEGVEEESDERNFTEKENEDDDHDAHNHGKNRLCSALYRSKVRRLRQGLETIPRKANEQHKVEVISLSNPLNRRNHDGLSAGTESGGHPEIAQVIRSVISERKCSSENFLRLRQIYDPNMNLKAAEMPIWPIRRPEIFTLLTTQLFDPFKKLSDDDKLNGAYILAVGSARVYGKTMEEDVWKALQECINICKDPETITLKGLAKGSERMQRLESLLKQYPPASTGVIRFVRACLLEETIHVKSFFSAGVMTLMHLLRRAVISHPLQRLIVFFTLSNALSIRPTNLHQTRLLEIKCAFVDELIFLMVCGFVSQVLEHIKAKAEADELEEGVLSDFVVKLANVAGGDFSVHFATLTLQLLSTKPCARAIRNTHNKSTIKVFNDLKQRCNSTIQFAANMPSSAVSSSVLGPKRVEPSRGLAPVTSAVSKREERIKLVPFKARK